MPWFKVDDTLPFHAKVVAAGNPAMGLWVRAGAWSSQQLTEGFVPKHIADSLGTPAQAKRLVSAGLWTEKDGGFLFWQWSDDGRQPTRAQVHAEREAARERQRRAREKSRRDKGVTGDAAIEDDSTRQAVDNAGPTDLRSHKDALISADQAFRSSLDPSAPADEARPSVKQRKPEKSGTDAGGHAVTDAVSHSVSHAAVTGVVTGPPTRPDPTRSNYRESHTSRNAPSDSSTEPPPDEDPATSPGDARCTAHRGHANPPPCAGCRAARELAEKRADRALDQAERATQAAARACNRCDGVWVVDPATALPTRQKCDHRRTA